MLSHLELLLHLARKSKFKKLTTTTKKLAFELKVSQQTISRKLRELESKNIIKRFIIPQGTHIFITSKGLTLLKEIYTGLKGIFDIKTLTATVVSGLKEGHYYMSLPKYKTQFKTKLKFEPYEGTLNLRIDPSLLQPFLADIPPIKIKGFMTKQRSFGAITCYKVKISNINAAMIFPERSKHRGIIEIIAPVHLRKKLKLKEGDKITIGK